jgi:hypothetical protein
VCHEEVDDRIAATGSMVEIMKNFNISTLTAPAGSYFGLRPDNVSDSAQEAGEIDDFLLFWQDVPLSSHEH